MRTWVRATLFFSSLSPLFLILWIQTIDFDHLNELDKIFTNDVLAFTFLAITILPNVVLFWMFKRCRRYSPYQLTVTNVSTRNSDVLNYIATYLIPFVTFNTDKINDLISFIVMMIVLAIVYVNANVFFINPLLNLFGYHVYQINDTHIVITRGSVIQGRNINVHTIQNNVYLGE